MTRILVVDDDPQILRALRITLTAHGYQVLTATGGVSALKTATDSPVETVVLDLGLPDLDGTEVIAGLRGWSRVPILVLSGCTNPDAKVNALDAGADDYLTKPFNMAELLARLRAIARRTIALPHELDPIVTTATFTIDLAAKKVIRDNAEVHLTPTEWGILEQLVRYPGKLVGQRQLLQHVWGPNHSQQTHYLRVYLAQLRRKLEPNPAQPRHLITEPRMGYRFEP